MCRASPEPLIFRKLQIKNKLSQSQRQELVGARKRVGAGPTTGLTQLVSRTLGIGKRGKQVKGQRAPTGLDGSGKFHYTLHNASLSAPVNNQIFGSIKGGVTRGIQRGARNAQKQTGALSMRPVDDAMLKQIGFQNIAGRMFEGVLSRMGIPFDKNRDPSADLDFPGGLGSKLGRSFNLPPGFPGDAKIRYTTAAIESIDKKVKNFIIGRFQQEAFVKKGKGVGVRPPRSQYIAYGQSFGTQGGISQGTIPALLTPGELVFDPQGVRQAGARNLEKFNATGNVRDIVSSVSPNNVSVVPGIGSGDTYPADLEPGSYVIKKRSSRNYTGGVFGNIQTAAHGGTIGRQNSMVEEGRLLMHHDMLVEQLRLLKKIIVR